MIKYGVPLEHADFALAMPIDCVLAFEMVMAYYQIQLNSQIWNVQPMSI